MGCLCSDIDIWDAKKKKNLENLNSVNRLKMRLLHVSKTDRFFLANLTPPPTSPLESLRRRLALIRLASLSFYRVELGELGDQGKPRWRLTMEPSGPTNFK